MRRRRRESEKKKGRERGQQLVVLLLTAKCKRRQRRRLRWKKNRVLDTICTDSHLFRCFDIFCLWFHFRRFFFFCYSLVRMKNMGRELRVHAFTHARTHGGQKYIGISPLSVSESLSYFPFLSSFKEFSVRPSVPSVGRSGEQKKKEENC